jgi:uncharacterized protein YggE
MRGIKELLVVAALAVLLVADISVGAATMIESQGVPPSTLPSAPRTITVVGTGSVSGVPDIAQLNVGAESKADIVSEAKTEVDRQMTAIMMALRGMGIGDGDIQTSHYSIHYERQPVHVVYEGLPGGVQTGYRVSSMLRVTVHDIEKAGDVLDAAVEAGANQVHGVTFTVSDVRTLQWQAREKAIADAEARATELAGLAGVQLGMVQSMSEVVGSWPMPATVVRDPGIGGGFAPGELELSTQVQVTYTIL